MVQRRLEVWLAQHVAKLLGPLADLEKGEGLDGIARGIAFQAARILGVLERAKVAEEVKALPKRPGPRCGNSVFVLAPTISICQI